MDFVKSVLASILGGALMLLIAAILSDKARWIFTAVLGRALGVDLEYVLPKRSRCSSRRQVGD
jgi:hypothetical protein